ncbi:hypothetical protein DACRYDRAFT_20955 [Dacryopinax primogenitus]|uniref:Uncharacterized protein n=1 Tax=Dacryopinax primogenitus (strain DJM 731) TaxID=1858805 RepID=M5GFT6_DACPD|nr:uncharacterized protein DACRYDRAFT_20955 [Dacryopinax primogenitus]EJU04418.1 hypothetical protein DACRYDRAFT_20955 [Dacryopinax primogenitus]
MYVNGHVVVISFKIFEITPTVQRGSRNTSSIHYEAVNSEIIVICTWSKGATKSTYLAKCHHTYLLTEEHFALVSPNVRKAGGKTY